jgi:hypothetical protein
VTYKSSSRDGATITLVAVHTAEGALTNTALSSFFSRPDAQGSAHASIDANGVLAMVPDYRASWTLRSGNPISLNVELCAYAEMTRTQWLSETDVTFYSTAAKRVVTVRRPREMLRHLSRWIYEKATLYGVPLTKLTPLQVGRGHAGVIGHVDWTIGRKDGTHHDPGDGCPWDVVLNDARAHANPAAAPEHKEDEETMFSVIIPAYEPPPVEDRVDGIDYSVRIGVPLPPAENGWECSIQTSGGVANIGHWYWTEQHADGALTTPAMDALTLNRLGVGRFDLQPGFRHTYPGHPNYSGVDIRVYRSPQPVVMVLRERRPAS